MIRVLGKSGNLLQIAAANAINESAESLNDNYKGRLKRNQRLRAERYTLGAVKTFKANPIRRSGEPRALHNINAKTGVRQTKGGEEHYLAKLEDAGRIKGNPKTENRVPVPLDISRTAGNENKPIATANRLTKKRPQTLRAGGVPIGIPGDRRKNGKKWASPGQRFAALYNYKKRGGRAIRGDLSKPFFFIDNSNSPGIFKFIRTRVHKIRDLSKKSTKINKKHGGNFKKAVKSTTPESIKKRFVKEAQKELGKRVK